MHEAVDLGVQAGTLAGSTCGAIAGAWVATTAAAASGAVRVSGHPPGGGAALRTAARGGGRRGRQVIDFLSGALANVHGQVASRSRRGRLANARRRWRRVPRLVPRAWVSVCGGSQPGKRTADRRVHGHVPTAGREDVQLGRTASQSPQISRRQSLPSRGRSAGPAPRSVCAGGGVAVEPGEDALGGEGADLGGVLSHHGDRRARPDRRAAMSSKPTKAIRCCKPSWCRARMAPMVTRFCEVNSAVGGVIELHQPLHRRVSLLLGAQRLSLWCAGRRPARRRAMASVKPRRARGPSRWSVRRPGGRSADALRSIRCWVASQRRLVVVGQHGVGEPARSAGGRRRRSACPARARPADSPWSAVIVVRIKPSTRRRVKASISSRSRSGSSSKLAAKTAVCRLRGDALDSAVDGG